MDEADRAQELDQAHREQAMHARSLAPRPLRQTGRTCLSCGEDIDPHRVAAQDGVATCIDCQTRLERGYR